MLQIVQISDIHIGAKGELTFEADGRGQFHSVLATVQNMKPDILILTGDLCLEDPQRSTYPWIKAQIDPLAIPYFAIAGNHDDSQMLAEVFHPDRIKGGELYYSERIQDHLIVFLDSRVAKFSENQWSWLYNTIQDANQTIHIFMHHPPIETGASYLDERHAFKEQSRFKKMMNQIDQQIHVYCGHFHTARYIQENNVHVHICPSTLFQMNAESQQFELNSTTPGFQLITIDQQRVETRITWC